MNPKMAIVKLRVIHWWDKLQKLYETDLGKPPKVTFSNRMTSTAGLAIVGRGVREGKPFRREVRFSLHFLYQESLHDFDQTIAHEVCHIFVDQFYKRRCKHGSEWQRAMVRLGLPPLRCHQYKSTNQRIRKPKIRVCCSKCKTPLHIGPVQSNRIKNGRVYKCSKCGTQIMSTQLY